MRCGSNPSSSTDPGTNPPRTPIFLFNLPSGSHSLHQTTTIKATTMPFLFPTMQHFRLLPRKLPFCSCTSFHKTAAQGLFKSVVQNAMAKWFFNETQYLRDIFKHVTNTLHVIGGNCPKSSCRDSGFSIQVKLCVCQPHL